jgi:hypothetical protein
MGETPEAIPPDCASSQGFLFFSPTLNPRRCKIHGKTKITSLTHSEKIARMEVVITTITISIIT